MLAIVSLLDVGEIPSKPSIHEGETMGVIATWTAVLEYVQLLSEACQVQKSEVGWTAYGTAAASFPLQKPALRL